MIKIVLFISLILTLFSLISCSSIQQSVVEERTVCAYYNDRTFLYRGERITDNFPYSVYAADAETGVTERMVQKCEPFNKLECRKISKNEARCVMKR